MATGTAARTMRKGELARRRVLDAVVDAVAARGLANVSVTEVGEAAGMSAGHVLYYFDNKDALFVQALEHMEAQLDEPRAAIVASRAGAPRRLRRYLALYLPTGPRDARWALWLEVWNRSVTDPRLSALQTALDRKWQDDLAAIVAAGVAHGDFAPIVADAPAAVAALLDGLAVRQLAGGPGDATNRSTLAAAEVGTLALLGASALPGR